MRLPAAGQVASRSTGLVPAKRAALLTARLAEPAGRRLRPAVAVERLPTARALGPPLPFGHVDLFAVAALRLRPDLPALRPPDAVVAVPRADERVGDLVQDRVAHLVVAVALDEVGRQLDAAGFVAAGIEADAGPADVRVQPELPVGQPVFV